jgi:hypothetical protein
MRQVLRASAVRVERAQRHIPQVEIAYRIGQPIDDGAGEPSDHFVGRSLGGPEPAPTDIVKAQYAGLLDRRNLGLCRKASFVGDGEGLDDPPSEHAAEPERFDRPQCLR